jgi:hypothetical protein
MLSTAPPLERRRQVARWTQPSVSVPAQASAAAALTRPFLEFGRYTGLTLQKGPVGQVVPAAWIVELCEVGTPDDAGPRAFRTPT